MNKYGTKNDIRKIDRQNTLKSTDVKKFRVTKHRQT